MNARDIEELREYIAAHLLILDGAITLVKTRKGIVTAARRVIQERMARGYSTQFRMDIWDGSRVQCSPGAHTSGQRGVRLSRLEDHAKAIPLGSFNPRQDVIGLRRNGDLVTIEVLHFHS